MNLATFFAAIAQISGLLFVISSMVAMGLSLTVEQIVAPLKSGRLVALALLANFILVPLIAALIIWLIPLADGLRVGLVLLATAAGAPFLPKLVQAAEGNVAMGVGLMVLLMVVTVIYMPLVLPLLLPGVAVDAWAIAQSLIVLMLIPLGAALLVRARLPETAATWQPVMNKVSTVALLLLMVTGLALNAANIVGLLGTGGILALLLLIVGSLGVGLVLGGREPHERSVMGLGTAQRNISAAIVVAAQNFTDPLVIVTLLVGAILLLLVLMGTARQLAKGLKSGAKVSTLVS